jgi:hypothetical protein
MILRFQTKEWMAHFISFQVVAVRRKCVLSVYLS